MSELQLLILCCADSDGTDTDDDDEDSFEDGLLPASMALSVTETADQRLLGM